MPVDRPNLKPASENRQVTGEYIQASFLGRPITRHMDGAGRNNPRKESRVISRCLLGAALVVTLGLCGVAVVPALLQSSPPEVPGSPTDAARDSLAGGSAALLPQAAADAAAAARFDSLAARVDSLTILGASLAMPPDSLARSNDSLALPVAGVVGDSLACRRFTAPDGSSSAPTAEAGPLATPAADAGRIVRTWRVASRAAPPGAGRADAARRRATPSGAIAAWQRANSDSGSIHPLRYWQSQDPAHDWLLLRLMRRAQSRHFVRSVLELKPALFTRGDSISQVVDLRSDSLQEAGVAEGVLYRVTRPRAGCRLPAAPSRSLARRDLVARQYDVDLEHQRVARSLLHSGEKVSAWTTETYGDYLARLTRVGARAAWKEEIAASMKAATVKGGRAGPGAHLAALRGCPRRCGRSSARASRTLGERQRAESASAAEPVVPLPARLRIPAQAVEVPAARDGAGSDDPPQGHDRRQARRRRRPVERGPDASLANRIQIHYKGYEDEIVRKIDLGNTSLDLPGTEYVSYGG